MKITYIDNPNGPRLGCTSAKLIEQDGLYRRIYHIQAALEDELSRETA